MLVTVVLTVDGPGNVIVVDPRPPGMIIEHPARVDNCGTEFQIDGAA